MIMYKFQKCKIFIINETLKNLKTNFYLIGIYNFYKEM